jgi:ElaB/YqjD/DUF883 family membrane-anchored ribosome-binding protein
VDNELEVIRHQMEGTRASLADKLDTLESHVLDTVHEATDAVSHTVEDVKSVVDNVTDSLQDTVETVKDAFNFSDHVRRHPWMSLGGAVAVGYVGGTLLLPARSTKESKAEAPARETFTPAPAATAARASAEESSLLAPLKQLKGLAIGALMGLVRELVSNSLPDNMKPDALSVVDDFTTRLGGKPLPAAEHCGNGKEKQPRSERETSGTEEGGQHNGHGDPAEMGRPVGAAQGEGEASVGKSNRRRPPPRGR